MLIAAGSVGTALGVLLVGPLGIRALAAARGGLPVAVRLALADLVRYRPGPVRHSPRSASRWDLRGDRGRLGRGRVQRPAGGRSRQPHRRPAPDPDRPPEPVIPERTPASSPLVQARTDASPPASGGASHPAGHGGGGLVRRLRSGGGRAVTRPSRSASPAGRRPTTSIRSTWPRPGCSRLYRADARRSHGTDVLTARTGSWQLVNIPARGVRPNSRLLPRPGYTHSRLADHSRALGRHGWQPARVGWFLAGRPSAHRRELATAQDLAAEPGSPSSRAGNRVAGATAHRCDRGRRAARPRGAGDDRRAHPRRGRGRPRTLTATGAPRRVRRTLTATTAGALALLGALLGVTARTWRWSRPAPSTSTRSARPVAHLGRSSAGCPSSPPSPDGCSPAASRGPCPTGPGLGRGPGRWRPAGRRGGRVRARCSARSHPRAGAARAHRHRVSTIRSRRSVTISTQLSVSRPPCDPCAGPDQRRR